MATSSPLEFGHFCKCCESVGCPVGQLVKLRPSGTRPPGVAGSGRLRRLMATSSPDRLSTALHHRRQSPRSDGLSLLSSFFFVFIRVHSWLKVFIAYDVSVSRRRIRPPAPMTSRQPAASGAL